MNAEAQRNLRWQMQAQRHQTHVQANVARIDARANVQRVQAAMPRPQAIPAQPPHIGPTQIQVAGPPQPQVFAPQRRNLTSQEMAGYQRSGHVADAEYNVQVRNGFAAFAGPFDRRGDWQPIQVEGEHDQRFMNGDAGVGVGVAAPMPMPIPMPLMPPGIINDPFLPQFGAQAGQDDFLAAGWVAPMQLNVNVFGNAVAPVPLPAPAVPQMQQMPKYGMPMFGGEMQRAPMQQPIVPVRSANAQQAPRREDLLGKHMAGRR
jgi:hypothetical protein